MNKTSLPVMNKIIANVSLGILLTLPSLEAGKVVIGAADNTAGGPRSVVAGGKNNETSAGFAFIGAGRGNKVEASDASVLGGNNNTVSGAKSSVLTGYLNNSAGLESAIVSGIRNITSAGAIRSAVLSGTDNVIEDDAWSSYIGGGYRNSNAGDRSAVLMGTDNVVGANALNTVVAGIKASSDHKNSFVFNSSLANPLATTKNGQFLVNATGGAIINGGTTIQGNLSVTGGLQSEGGVVMVGEKGDAGPQGPRGTRGVAGQDGSAGAGISDAEIVNGNLILFLTNGETINAGSVGGDGGGGAVPLDLRIGSTIAWQNPYYNETVSAGVTQYDPATNTGEASAEILDSDPGDADRNRDYTFEYSFINGYDEIDYREIGVVSTDQETLDHLNNIISDPTNPITVAINAYIAEPSSENDQRLNDAIFVANLNYSVEVTNNDEIFIHIGGEVRVDAFSTIGTQTIYGPQIRLNSGNTAFEFVGGGYVGITTSITNFEVVE